MLESKLAATVVRVLGIASIAAFALWPKEAHAGPQLALDLDYVGGIDEPGIGHGTGGQLRFGQQLDLVAVNLTGELGISYHTFDGPGDPSHYSGFVGGRLGFGKILEPSIFAHVGVGRLNAFDEHDTGPVFDLGVALDLTVLPLLDIGVHAAYDFQRLDTGNNLDFYRVGAHVALVF